MYLLYRNGKYIANGQDTTKMVTLVIRISYFTRRSIPAVKDMAEKKEDDTLLDIGFRLLSVAILFWSVERS